VVTHWQSSPRVIVTINSICSRAGSRVAFLNEMLDFQAFSLTCL
jgi:hypothetical protein